VSGTGSPNKPRPPIAGERDGTSQADRALPALAAGYVALDERTTADLLSFARAYSHELRYVDSHNQPAGDWSSFIPAELPIEDVVRFLQDPASFSAASRPELFRPHFVLFLVFLKLLERSRQSLNAVLQRHLDFYLRHYLRLAPKPSTPDRVNVVVDLAKSARGVQLPAGTQLNAGPDQRGIDRIYSTDRDLWVNRAQVAALRSLYIDCRRTTLRQAPLRHPNDAERTCELMFRIALGNPLPPFSDGREVNIATLRALREALRQQEAATFLPVATLRELMTQLALRPPPPAEWAGRIAVAASSRSIRTPRPSPKTWSWRWDRSASRPCPRSPPSTICTISATAPPSAPSSPIRCTLPTSTTFCA
jgi:hypothetical protein